MSRSGYSDDCDGWALIRWRGAVKSAVNGARGQAMLRELLAALDAMPVKKLIPHELQSGGEFCALGAIGHARGLPMDGIDTEDRDAVAGAFGIATALAAEIMFQNDDDFAGYWRAEDPAARWLRMRKWVEQQITVETT